ncbi:MAG: hypothetical protein ISQ13_01280 [Candidatus Margulisbacteria bacterium]|nr:hypothetical protein [Candidatus Margulisiibacteriota bacterium]
MSSSNDISNDMQTIMSLLQEDSPDILDLCDLVYHYNKSLGLTYTTIRDLIADLPPVNRYIALGNFLKVIQELTSPQLFIHIDD